MIKINTLNLLSDNVLIEVDKTRKSEIILTEEKGTNRGWIRRAGPWVGEVEEGDYVIFDRGDVEPLDWAGESFLIGTESSILAKLDEPKRRDN